MQIKFKLIFVKKNKKDGTPYTKMMTILKDGDNEVWVDVKFGESVNDKLFKGENQIITADNSKVRLPLSLKPYVNKEGKTKYPYVWVDEIIDFKKYVYNQNKSKPKETTQNSFSFTEEDTQAVSDKDLPF